MKLNIHVITTKVWKTENTYSYTSEIQEAEVVKLVRERFDRYRARYYYEAWVAAPPNLHPDWANSLTDGLWVALNFRHINPGWKPPKTGWVNDTWTPPTSEVTSKCDDGAQHVSESISGEASE